jgi:hypothetical protein
MPSCKVGGKRETQRRLKRSVAPDAAQAGKGIHSAAAPQRKGAQRAKVENRSL